MKRLLGNRLASTLGGAALAFTCVGLLAPSAHAVSLTGTWVGNETCTFVTSAGDTDKTGKMKNLTVKISQDSGDPTLHHMYFVENNRYYSGIVLDEAGNSVKTQKAVATFASCPTAPATPGLADLPVGSEMVHANFVFNLVGTVLDKLATGFSLVYAEDGSQQSCKWNTFKRVDDTDPLIPPC
ncbi:MAG TPA: hypothetical protein VFD92_03660 [Candidatus Binatia bacterium]|nr:hypothetical protein [Candidatus Binatia bacterium]